MNALNTLFLSSFFLVLCTACTRPETANPSDDCTPPALSNAPNASFFTAYGGSGEESHGHYILNCFDGGYLQVGETGFIPQSAKLLVIKTDALGQLLWKKEFAAKGHNLGNAALEVNDGYLICGAINEDSALLKLNKEDGALLFQKTYDNGGSDAFEHLAFFHNKIVAVGYTHAQAPNNTFFTEGRALLTFLDATGNKIETKKLPSLAHAYRISAYNNTLFIAGLTEEAMDYGLLKLDAKGDSLWDKTFGGAAADHCFGMDIGADGAIFLTGHTLSDTENWDTYTQKINGDGRLIWEIKQGNPRGFDPAYIHDEAWGVSATPDGGCLVVAGTGDEYDSYSASCSNGQYSDRWYVYLIKLNAAGALEWQKTVNEHASEEDWAGEAVALTPDGGAIIAVDNGQFGFLKIDPF